MGQIRVVHETNVLVSALGFGGTPLECLFRGFDPDIEIAVSERTLSELERVMGYDHLPFTADEREQFLSLLSREATIVRPRESIAVVEDDPDDDAFTECAVAANAEYIIPGDRHLLDLGGFRDIGIVSPAEFLERTDDSNG